MNFELTLDHWKESLAHLRHLSCEVNRTFQFWVLVNLSILFLLAAAPGIHLSQKAGTVWLARLIILLAIGLTVGGRYLLRRSRIYYLQMLAKKSLIEDDLGFYQRKFPNSESVDLAFPWRITPEVISIIQKDFDSWVAASVRPWGTMANIQFLCLEGFLVIYSGLFFLTLIDRI